jgi:adenylosuccinate synthase
VYYHELGELARMGVDPQVIVSDSCMITTPYDVFINREMERQRSGDRHGSCGLGFGETIERIQARGHGAAYSVSDLLSFTDAQWREYMEFLRCLYVPGRLANCGFVYDSDTQVRAEYACNDEMFIKRFRDMFDQANIQIRKDDEILEGFDHLVFEGAQGLLLDMDYGQFPHVTRSNTGVKNVLTVIKETDTPTDEVLVWYTSRIYMTRHGAGPLEHEGPLVGVNVRDQTNIPNAWQGQLRLAPLNEKSLFQRTADDFEQIPFEAEHNLVLTCCDQVQERAVLNASLSRIAEADQYEQIWTSHGPTRATLKVYR